ncbi:hypothetical protein JCM18905_393 [Vibrio sp. JCM 18905]|nr:hypothetical protein JCM18905_393 [Vibrio sp. JCM 18905]
MVRFISPQLSLGGADRGGATSFVEIRSSSTSEDAYDSYQFPIRLVAVKGQ